LDSGRYDAVSAAGISNAYQQSHGLTRANDKLPKAMPELFPAGGSAGYVPDVKAMPLAYNELRDGDCETGKLAREKLRDESRKIRACELDNVRQFSVGVFILH
jgi:hypothetical protein